MIGSTYANCNKEKPVATIEGDNYRLELCTGIKRQQFTEKLIVNESGTNEIKVKLIVLRATNETPENLPVSIQLIEKSSIKVHEAILATKTKPTAQERTSKLISNFTNISDSNSYFAVFKVCIKRAAKEVRFLITAENSEHTLSNAFTVFSMKKSHKPEELPIYRPITLPPITQQLANNDCIESNMKISDIIPNKFLECSQCDAVIFGNNLTAMPVKVYFGEQEADIRSLNPNFIIVTIPPQQAGQFHVTINKNRNLGVVIFNYITAENMIASMAMKTEITTKTGQLNRHIDENPIKFGSSYFQLYYS